MRVPVGKFMLAMAVMVAFLAVVLPVEGISPPLARMQAVVRPSATGLLEARKEDASTEPATDVPATDAPASEAPSDDSTDAPTDEPSDAPTDEPSDAPSDEPSNPPTDAPSSASALEGDIQKTNEMIAQLQATVSISKDEQSNKLDYMQTVASENNEKTEEEIKEVETSVKEEIAAVNDKIEEVAGGLVESHTSTEAPATPAAPTAAPTVIVTDLDYADPLDDNSEAMQDNIDALALDPEGKLSTDAADMMKAEAAWKTAKRTHRQYVDNITKQCKKNTCPPADEHIFES